MSERKPRPVAFRLDDDRVAIEGGVKRAAPVAVVEEAPEAFETPESPVASAPRRRRMNFGALLAAGLGGLASLGVGLWVSSLIEALFQRAGALGYFGLALLALALLGLVGLGWREARALLRQREIAKMAEATALAYEKDDRVAARSLVAELIDIYRDRPETAHGRAATARAARDIVDGRDLLTIAERELLLPLDERAKHVVALAAKRVSMVTAISPRAILDFLFAAAQLVHLTRSLAEIYGGRPGLLGFLSVARSAAAHLAITGGMAAGDSLLQQVVGHGIASRISARLGEGVLNGLMTTRVGLAAIAACRPAPFLGRAAPNVQDVAPFLFRGAKDRDA